MKKIIKVTLILLISLLSCSFIIKPVYADSDEILQISGFTELMKCYKDKKLKDKVSDVSTGLKLTDVFQSDGDTHYAKVPNQWKNTVNDADLSCSQLVGGYTDTKFGTTGTYPRLISGAMTTMRDQSEAVDFLKRMGYESASGSGGSGTKNYVSFVYEMSYQSGTAPNKKVKTNQIFISDINNGKFTSTSIIEVVSVNNGDGLTHPIPTFIVDNGTTLQIKCDATRFTRGKCKNSNITIAAGGTWDKFVNDVYQELKTNAPTSSVSPSYDEVGRNYTLLLYDKSAGVEGGVEQGSDGNDITSGWQLVGNDYTKASNIALTSNTSFTSASDLKFTEEQKKTLHQHYFNNVYKAKLICEDSSEYSSLTGTAKKVDSIKSKNCFAEVAGKADDTVHAIKPDLTWYVDYTFDELIKNMTEDELLTAPDAKNADQNGDKNDSDSDSASREPDCQTRSGALGWIICPLITTAADYIQRAYVNLIEPFLSIDAVLFDTSTNGGKALRNIWAIFQGFANLIFVIVFLIVIFSQLTGVGIDNYGIKKILPKLVVGAILINLSYFICQLAIDLSNILGRAIGGLFNNMSAEIDSDLSQVYVNLNPTESATGVQAFVDLAKDNLGVVIGIAGVLAFGAFLAAGPVIIIPALLALISLAVGAFFLFALLAIRQAVAVILVVVSPLAFAAYMLPNTKSLFKRWFDTFKGLLMAYPIASALVFGGEFVSKILLAASTSNGGGGEGVQKTITSLGIILSAAVVAVAPIFYIPSLIKKSLTALSGVTAALATKQRAITSGAQKRVDSGLRNSGWQRSANERHQRFAAGISRSGKLTPIGHLQNTWPSRVLRGAGGRAKLAEARSKALSNVNSNITSDRMLTGAGVLAAGATIANKAKSQLVDDEIANMETTTANYNVDVMDDQLNKILSSKTINADDKVKAQALMKKLSQSGGDGNKRLANIIRNNAASDEGKVLLASYATSTDIAGNIGNKDAYVTQYLRDFQAGTNNADKSFEVWSSTERFGADGKSLGSNEEFVAQKQLDDDERLLQQSTDSLKQTYKAGSLDQERATRIQGNDNLNKKDDQHKILTNVKKLTNEQYAARRDPKDRNYVDPFDIKPKNTTRPRQSTP